MTRGANTETTASTFAPRVKLARDVASGLPQERNVAENFTTAASHRR